MFPLPVRLKEDTIVEALFEVRFTPTEAGIANLLPGYFRSSLPELVEHVERLGAADLPPQILNQDQNLRYRPAHRLSGERYQISTGEYVANISIIPPYPGWNEFRPKIIDMINTLKQYNVVETYERISLRYTNIVPELDDIIPLDAIQCSVQLGMFDLGDYGFNLRSEIPLNGCTNIVQVAPSTTARNNKTGYTRAGTYLDIDTILPIGGNDHSGDEPNFYEVIEVIHDTEKQIFFSILSSEMQARLGAEYE